VKDAPTSMLQYSGRTSAGARSRGEWADRRATACNRAASAGAPHGRGYAPRGAAHRLTVTVPPRRARSVVRAHSGARPASWSAETIHSSTV
jgi:hypothetical protein